MTERKKKKKRVGIIVIAIYNFRSIHHNFSKQYYTLASKILLWQYGLKKKKKEEKKGKTSYIDILIFVWTVQIKF